MVMKRRQKLKSRAAALSGVSPVSKDSGGGVRKARTRKEAIRNEKKRDLIDRETVLAKKKSKKKSPKWPGLKLDGLQAALMATVEDEEEAGAASKKKKGGVNIRSRKHRIREESAQLSSVLENEAFKNDPVAALREHLLNTVCANPLNVPAKPDESLKPAKNVSTKQSTPPRANSTSMKLEIDKEELHKMKETARERIRAKRERKEAMAQAAQAFQQKNKHKLGVVKIRASPHRGRIGVKRPKLLDDTDINMDK